MSTADILKTLQQQNASTISDQDWFSDEQLELIAKVEAGELSPEPTGPVLYPVSDEPEAYAVNVCRTGYGFNRIEVMAKSAPEAIEKALEEAGSHSFSDKSSEYTEDGVTKL
jgi:hypothetical protein